MESTLLSVGSTFFQICGFCPIWIGNFRDFERRQKAFSIRQSGKYFVWSLMLIACLVCVLTAIVVNQEKFLYAKTPIGKINDVLVLFSLLIAHISILIESLVKRKYFMRFWCHYDKAMRIGRSKRVSDWQALLLVKVLASVCFIVIIETLVISNISSDEQWSSFWWLAIFSLLMTRLRTLQHIFFIDVIFFTLEDMNARLRNAIAWTKAIGVEQPFGRQFLYGNVTQTKEQFKHLMEMIICINKIFCWSQVLNVGQCFIEVSSELFWVYAFATGPEFMWRKAKRHSVTEFRSLSRFFISDSDRVHSDCRYPHHAVQLGNAVHKRGDQA
jgi:7tm Chemosensory receptor